MIPFLIYSAVTFGVVYYTQKKVTGLVTETKQIALTTSDKLANAIESGKQAITKTAQQLLQQSRKWREHSGRWLGLIQTILKIVIRFITLLQYGLIVLVCYLNQARIDAMVSYFVNQISSVPWVKYSIMLSVMIGGVFFIYKKMNN